MRNTDTPRQRVLGCMGCALGILSASGMVLLCGLALLWLWGKLGL